MLFARIKRRSRKWELIKKKKKHEIQSDKSHSNFNNIYWNFSASINCHCLFAHYKLRCLILIFSNSNPLFELISGWPLPHLCSNTYREAPISLRICHPIATSFSTYSIYRINFETPNRWAKQNAYVDRWKESSSIFV